MIQRPPRPTPVPGKVRVGIIVTAMYVGGAERWVADLVSATSSSIEWVGIGVVKGVFGKLFDEMIHVPLFCGEWGCKELGRQCDVLIVWTIKNALPYAPRGVPVIAVSHSPPQSTWARDFFGDDGVIGATHYVGVSDTAVNCFAEKDRAGAAIIEHGVNPDRVKPLIDRHHQRERWGINPHSVVVGYIGRLSAEKRYHLTWQCLRYLSPNHHAILVGDGPFVGQDRKACAAEAGDRAKLVGPTTDIGSALGAMDCVVVASEYESFCYTIVEAWAAGVPVISTLTGVARTWPDFVHRLPDDPRPEDVAEKVIESEDPTRAVCAKRLARWEYSWAAFGMRWTNYIWKVHKDQCKRLELL